MISDHSVNSNASSFGVNNLKVKEKWELPSILLEVSGIEYISPGRFACIQDELGTIFIYNTSNSTIEKEIKFAGPGDYEDLALNGNKAYIVRSDGLLFEVDLKTNETQELQTGFNASNNIEGLFYEQEANRLLLAMKNPDPTHDGQSSIYAYSLKEKKTSQQPVYSIRHKDTALNSTAKKKLKAIMPSAVAIHPVTKEIYITDGPGSRLIIMDKSGKVNTMYELGREFFQPEGISITESGEIYISNEGKKQPANIMRIEIK